MSTSSNAGDIKYPRVVCCLMWCTMHSHDIKKKNHALLGVVFWKAENWLLTKIKSKTEHNFCFLIYILQYIARITYTRQLPIEMQCSKRRRIRLCSSSSKAKGTFCSCVAWGWRIYNIVESESDPLTHRPVDLFEKVPLKGKWDVHLHTPTKFDEDPSKDLGGDREQTNTHTNKRCSNYSMIHSRKGRDEA